jgi:SAM-dependent methyltransferase
MRAQFPLFNSHLELAHLYWEKLVHKGDLVIDATCGNGHDTLILAQLCADLKGGLVYALDILPRAIELTQKYLHEKLPSVHFQRVRFILGCHSTFPEEIFPESVKLITYNLGYLPGGGDKTLTTTAKTTLESIKKAMLLLQPGGAISITLYPGHPEGQCEEQSVLSLVEKLNPLEWSCSHHQWINRHKKSPHLLFIQKRLVI